MARPTRLSIESPSDTSTKHEPYSTFPILDLPAEIRLRIYKFVFCDLIVRRPAYVWTALGGKSYSQTVDYDHMSILLSCRSIRTEAMEMFWRETHFSLTAYASSGDFGPIQKLSLGLPFGRKTVMGLAKDWIYSFMLSRSFPLSELRVFVPVMLLQFTLLKNGESGWRMTVKVSHHGTLANIRHIFASESACLLEILTRVRIVVQSQVPNEVSFQTTVPMTVSSNKTIEITDSEELDAEFEDHPGMEKVWKNGLSRLVELLGLGCKAPTIIETEDESEIDEDEEVESFFEDLKDFEDLRYFDDFIDFDEVNRGDEEI